MIYITGDTHGNFSRIKHFCGEHKTTKKDILIILGDVGINYFGERDIIVKESLSKLPITLFCIHGNHENRPQNINSYKKLLWKNGFVYYEPEYDNILFPIDGEVFSFNGYRCIVIGGAYSIDKCYRIQGYDWWEDEQPSDEIKEYVEDVLSDTEVDIVLTHTCPLKYEPTEVFLPFIDQSKVDKSTEKWLDKIEDSLDYKKWYCGHYHTEKKIDKVQFMFNSIERFYKGEKYV